MYSDKAWCWKLHKDGTSCSWMFRVAVGCKLLLYAVTWHQILLSVALCYWLVSPDVAWCCWSLYVCVCTCMLFLDVLYAVMCCMGYMMLHSAKWCYDLYSDKAWCWKLHKDGTSCSWMFIVAVGCKLLLYAVNWHQILLSVAQC